MLLPPRWQILNNFYLNNQYLSVICYFVNGICYTISFSISFLLSFNVYIALCHPLNYSKLFKKKNIIIFIISIFILGCLFGSITINTEPFYQELQQFIGLNIGFRHKEIGLYVLLYTFMFIIPLAIISTIFYILAIKKFTQQIHIKNFNSRKKIELILYGTFSLLIFFLCSGCFIVRSVNGLTTRGRDLEIIIVRITPFVFDAQTIGLFALNLFISEPLRKIMMFKLFKLKVKFKVIPSPP